MREFTSSAAQLSQEHGISVGRWSQYAGLDQLPFDAMWCVIPPAAASARDQHPEIELAVVLSGAATFDVGGREVSGTPGSAVLFESTEPHVIHNRSTDEPLVLLSVYWMPDSADRAAEQR